MPAQWPPSSRYFVALPLLWMPFCTTQYALVVTRDGNSAELHQFNLNGDATVIATADCPTSSQHTYANTVSVDAATNPTRRCRPDNQSGPFII